MKIKWQSWKRKCEYRAKWHRWFAWYPVRCYPPDGDTHLTWLSIVERKGEYYYGIESGYWNYQHREVDSNKSLVGD